MANGVRQELERLYGEIAALCAEAKQLCAELEADIRLVPSSHRESATNLIHYVSLRRRDIRALQMELSRWGLSSLGRLEGHVMAGLRSVEGALSAMLGLTKPSEIALPPDDFRRGDERLAQHTALLCGPKQRDHGVHIMVTLGPEAAADPMFVLNLVSEGMDVARINTAHDGPEQWASMIKNVRSASAATGLSCKVLMDLEGPKLRTGALAERPRILHVTVTRDDRGVVRSPSEIRLVPSTEKHKAEAGELPLPILVWESLREGDLLTFTDLPGRKRELRVAGRDGSIIRAHTWQPFFVEPGIEIKQVRDGRTLAMGTIGNIATSEAPLWLRDGDQLMLVGPERLGEPARYGQDGGVTRCAQIPCSLPEVFNEVAVNDRIFFDDGKIAAVVRQRSPEQLLLDIQRTPPGGTKLGADKGINLPDTVTSLPALSPEDLGHLDFAVAQADLLGLSFVRTPQDIEQLYNQLDKRNAKHLGIVLKIETKLGFENLPQLLLTALRRPPCGVMVARGDLGVELGFERMAEVQEQILWLCEAAHVPVIWATQVLDTLNKKGMPTRSEVTDAAMSARAECVMLNKGPHVLSTVRFLADILRRMQDHHHKKSPMLRKLKVSEGRWFGQGVGQTQVFDNLSAQAGKLPQNR